LTLFGVLIALLAAARAVSSDSATVWGFVQDAASRPVPGARVLLEDQLSHVLFTSSPADLSGQFSVTLPAGKSYRMVGALAPDGTRIPLQADTPVNARTPGRYRADARYRDRIEPPALGSRGEPQAPFGVPEAKAWYKRPAGIAGLVAAHAAAAAVLLSGGSEPAASPFQPGS
jgi:hypothetical protein